MTFESAKGFTMNLETGKNEPLDETSKNVALAMLNADPAPDLQKALVQLSYNMQKLFAAGQASDGAMTVMWPMMTQALDLSGIETETYHRLAKLFTEMTDVMIKGKDGIQ